MFISKKEYKKKIGEYEEIIENDKKIREECISVIKKYEETLKSAIKIIDEKTFENKIFDKNLETTINTLLKIKEICEKHPRSKIIQQILKEIKI